MEFKYIIYSDNTHILFNKKNKHTDLKHINKSVASAGNGIFYYDYDYDKLKVVCVSGSTTIKDIPHSLVRSGRDSAFLNKFIK